MKTGIHVFTLCLASVIATGCTTSSRSISNSHHPVDDGRHRGHHYHSTSGNPFAYRGELSEFDLLGVDLEATVDDGSITEALNAAKSMSLRSGQTVLLVQSGAAIPDAEMVNALGEHFTVVPFSGVPSQDMRARDNGWIDRPDYSRSFRLAAARAGAEHIICYWGELRTLREDMRTKTVSWVPVVGWMLPDENQATQLRLKFAVIDVATGAWSLMTPAALHDESVWSSRFTRSRRDQEQVNELKRLAYANGVEELTAGYLP